MHNFFGPDYGMGYGMGGFGPLTSSLIGFGIIVLIWSFLWKGLALWRAAKRGEKIWFVVFLFVNTLGILEIIYLFLITGAKLSEFTDPISGKSHHEHSNS